MSTPLQEAVDACVFRVGTGADPTIRWISVVGGRGEGGGLGRLVQHADGGIGVIRQMNVCWH